MNDTNESDTDYPKYVHLLTAVILALPVVVLTSLERGGVIDLLGERYNDPVIYVNLLLIMGCLLTVLYANYLWLKERVED